MNTRRQLHLVLTGLALGYAFDLLFTGKLLGISVTIFSLLLLAGLGLAMRWEETKAFHANLWLLGALLFFAAMCFIRANGFLTFLNVSSGLVLLTIIAVYMNQQSIVELRLLALLVAPLQAFGLSLYHGGQVVGRVQRHDLLAMTPPTRQRAAAILRGLLLAMPALLVFTILLASADLIFADMIMRLVPANLMEAIGRWMGHGLVILSIGFLATGGLAYAARRREADLGKHLSWATLKPFLGFTESMVVTNTVNVLFLLFVVIQVPYLFGGQINISLAKFTFAEYARRGFAELVLVAMMTLGMVMLLGAVTQHGGSRHRLASNASNTLLLSLTCVMLVSAFKRLLLYETAYGFSELRVYVHVFMVWLGLLLLWFVFTLWFKPKRFAVGALVAALCFVATLDLLNPDALIVRQNAQRYQGLIPAIPSQRFTARQIDVHYLTTLSEDAVPALIVLADQSTGETQRVLEEYLQQRTRVMRADIGWRRWQSYHWSRRRAYQFLVARYDGG